LKYNRKRPQETYSLTNTINEECYQAERSIKKLKPWTNDIDAIESKVGAKVKAPPVDEESACVESSLLSKGKSRAAYSDSDSDLCDVDLDEVLNNRLTLKSSRRA
jgi:hypothetical protein